MKEVEFQLSNGVEIYCTLTRPQIQVLKDAINQKGFFYMETPLGSRIINTHHVVQIHIK